MTEIQTPKNSSPSKTLRICMTGTWLSSSNVGDNAIMFGILQSFKKHANAKFTVFTSTPERVKRIYKIDALRFKSNPLKLIHRIKKSDVFLFTGGTPFYDHSIHMLYFLFLALWAKIFRVPVMVFGISLRPVSKLIPCFCLKTIGSICAYFGVREYNSQRRARKLLFKRDQRKIKILPDLSLQISEIPPGLLSEFNNNEKISPSKDYVAICPRSFRSGISFQRQHHDEKYNVDEVQNYFDILKQITVWLVKEKNLNVIFLPMHIHSPDDDRFISNEMLQSIEDMEIRKRIHVVQKQYDPLSIISVLSHVRYVIGVRFHAVLLSLATTTPAINIVYAEKNKAVMEMFHLNDFAHSMKSLSFESIKKSIILLENDREQIKNNISTCLDGFKKSYDEELQRILKFIK